MLKELTFESAAHFLSMLVDMGDSYYRYGDQLAERGFVAFQANLNLFEGLAKDQHELDLHRELEKERAKENFANPFHTFFELEGRLAYRSPYKSALLEELRTKNEPRIELRLNPKVRDDEWNLLMGPCRRAYEQLDYAIADARRHSCQVEFRKLRAAEIERHLPPPHTRIRGGNEESRDFAYEVFGKGLARFGFTANPKLSTKTARFFTKPLVDEWIINMTMINDSWGNLEGGYEIIDGVQHWDPKNAHFRMDLRRSKQKSLFHKKLAVLPLSFANMSPLGEHQYTSYMDMDELAVGLLGYTEFYGLIANNLETRLIEGLSEL
ncbi:hypothetical protein [Chitinimonas sp. BJB300]|uniref:hypothetical protein n=1 Tax=Chitinimonas sp. BJB300 TaxID=1559339 RepID=UPI000C0D840D|nr:hypothetical protein [Chitinimonas sp. BJB300]PHV12234.1 hypothetical protein CSQ89_06810 [Chitinimonas sp. BJB300]TSJ85209.1 hypothetical protein FG002_018080 [Chitinimonas sp. BJB300]